MGEREGWCCCKGKCGGNGAGEGIGRRDFLKTAAASAGGLALLGSGSRAFAAADAAALKAWTEDLWKRGERRVYRGAELEHIAMPLGGIGAGQFYLTGRGGLGSWQITNNFNTAAQASGAFFGLWTRTADGQATARLLQEGEAGGVPGMAAVEFAGEFPFAWLRYSDDAVPVEVSLEAFTPLIPHDADESGLPLALFRFTLANRSAGAVDAAVLASAPNLAGWEGYSPIEDAKHADCMNNVNTVEQREGATVLNLQTRPGTPAAFARALGLYTDDGGTGSLLRFCGNLKVQLDKLPESGTDPATAVLWPRRIVAANLQPGLDAVRGGASLVASGGPEDLLACAVAPEVADAPVVFEDWAEDSYARWTLEGDCFGDAPATGTLPGQQAVSGWTGKGFVNTFAGGDDTTGRAVSRPFTVEKRYILSEVGGGKFPKEACLNLVVDGAAVRSATGENSEQLRPVRWDVSEFIGKSATLEIVDRRKGGWGHVLVGSILFSDAALSPNMDPAVVRACREALPFTWTGARLADGNAAVKPDAAFLDGVHGRSAEARGHAVFDEFTLKDGARVLLETQDGAPLVVAGPLGKGTVVVCNGPILEWFEPADARNVAGRLIAEASGAKFTPQTGWAADSVTFGSMALAALPGEGVGVSARPQWDDAAVLWDDFESDGRLEAGSTEPSAPGRTWHGALSGSVRLEPGESRRVTFALAWHFPNRTRDSHFGWGFRFPGPLQYDFRLGNRYNNRFQRASGVIDYALANLERLESATRLFHDTFYDSTLPRWLLDGVTANVANIRSPIFVWIEDGSFGGFEGADACCPLNCTHVYNYAMTTAYLFPELERNVREIDLLHQMNPEGHFIPHRTVLPLSEPRMGNTIAGPLHHALDGELGTLLKACREWRLNGDGEWLKKVWPRMRLVMEHVLRDHDVAGDGVIRGEQPNTYDTHLFGSNTFVGSLYLATLRAMEEMARAMGEEEFAGQCGERFRKGYEGYDRNCWNGEYYENKFDDPKAQPDVYNQNNCYGPGCFSDQLFGQWWAWMLNLGDILPPEHVKTTLESTFKYNWRSDLSDHAHSQRVFAEGNEKGLLVGSWPRGGRPEKPILYCDEVWTGIEYHVAASLICAGFVEQGMQVAKGARDRYTGSQRNPFAEVECGHHYARALSSYSLLPALAGFDYDGAGRRMTVAPRVTPEDFRSFFSADRGWGTLACSKGAEGLPRCAVSVKHGSVRIETLRVPAATAGAVAVAATVAGKAVAAEAKEENGYYAVTFPGVELAAGQTLELEFRRA